MCRLWSPGSSRWTCSKACTWPWHNSKAVVRKSRINMPARYGVPAIALRRSAFPKCSKSRSAPGAGSARFPRADYVCVRRTVLLTRKFASRSTSAVSRNRANASPGSCCRASASPTNVRRLEPDARRIVPSERRWFRRKARVQLTFILEGGKKMAFLACPLPRPATDRILLAHGGGGRLTNQLIENVFLSAFSNSALKARHDGAVFFTNGGGLAMTTDTYVVQPLVFPGGTIGDLAVNGTVNDLAMCGARPLALSAGFILEEGLPMMTLCTIVDSMAEAARVAEVPIVTGDTKVVDKGKGDGLFVNTAGIGVVIAPKLIGPESVCPGDAVLISGDLGSHGTAILSVRNGLEFEGEVKSDTAPVWPAVEALFEAGIEVHCMRDLTRGGLSSALNEIASLARLRITVDEVRIPVSGLVRGACELLGLDPLYVANEGRFVAFVPEREADHALEILRSQTVSAGAVRAGTVHEGSSGIVTLQSRVGGHRVLDMLSGEQLPRIC